ncbi:Pyridoxine 5'-phosphate synthase [invertebrate metagenome]|uniref:Pyridoxine 5'-phosphate synthase n=1 Tax=invertebrate metagenome TaxID=1711999 RepID=A0A2H9T8I1_9ZZZZ
MLDSQRRILLGVNIDHVATLRQMRQGRYPDPVQAAILVEEAGADSITMHLREDRRHIQERDVRLTKEVIQGHLNLEMAVTREILAFAEELCPDYACLVPERRQELTTEGGLDVVTYQSDVSEAVRRLDAKGVLVSLFIDPEKVQIDAAVASGAPVIELHTGAYANADSSQAFQAELSRLEQATEYALGKGLIVNAGHGLNYQNVEAVAAIEGIHELNIGHSIVARALFTGLKAAVTDMKSLLKRSCYH